MTREQIAGERRRPAPMADGWSPISPALLRQAEDQTVVSLAAVRAALGRLDDRDPARFDGWGILAASRFLGRSGLVQAIAGFQSEGVWSVSPHLIPHLTLHSPAGTLSQAMGIHGPNLGIGGGPGSAFEGFLTALTWIGSGLVPGLWLVLTGWSPEFVPGLRAESRVRTASVRPWRWAWSPAARPCPDPGHTVLALVESDLREAPPTQDFAELDAMLPRSASSPGRRRACARARPLGP